VALRRDERTHGALQLRPLDSLFHPPFYRDVLLQRAVESGALEKVGQPVRHALGERFQGALELGGESGGQLVLERTARGVQEVVEEPGDRAIEGLAHAGGGELAGEVCFGEQTLADRLADTLGESRLVLGDRPLELEPSHAAGFVRVKQHPHGHGGRDAPGESTYEDRHDPPRSTPATIHVNAEQARAWLEKGAQPTDTVRSLLRKAGVLAKRPA